MTVIRSEKSLSPAIQRSLSRDRDPVRTPLALCTPSPPDGCTRPGLDSHLVIHHNHFCVSAASNIGEFRGARMELPHISAARWTIGVFPNDLVEQYVATVTRFDDGIAGPR